MFLKRPKGLFQWVDNVTDEPLSEIFETFREALDFLLEKNNETGKK